MADNTKPKVDWELLALTDQYSTAVAIREAVRGRCGRCNRGLRGAD